MKVHHFIAVQIHSPRGAALKQVIPSQVLFRYYCNTFTYKHYICIWQLQCNLVSYAWYLIAVFPVTSRRENVLWRCSQSCNSQFTFRVHPKWSFQVNLWHNNLLYDWMSPMSCLFGIQSSLRYWSHHVSLKY